MKTIKKILLVAGAIALMIATLVFKGFVVARLWAWFIVQTFHVEPITIWDAAGLIVLYRAFAIKFDLRKYNVKRDGEYYRKMTAWHLGTAAIALVIGYLIHLIRVL